MDSLICQAYYNPALITVLKQLIIGDGKKGKSQKNKSSITDINFNHVPTSNLYHIKCPSIFVGRKYSKLFDSLTTRRYIIPMGLYRQSSVWLKAYKENQQKFKGKTPYSGFDKKEASEWSDIKYVVTNPDKDTKLRENDLIFVLAKNEPGDPETWDDYNENNKDMFDAN